MFSKYTQCFSSVALQCLKFNVLQIYTMILQCGPTVFKVVGDFDR